MLLNSTQAKKIFDKYSFLWEGQDVMISSKAGDLFSDDAVIYAIRARNNGLETAIGADPGDGHIQIFLTYEGLKQAISYSNQQEILNRNKMLYGEKPDLKDEEWHEVKEESKVISFEERRKKAWII